MRYRWFAALVAAAGVVAIVGVLGGGTVPGVWSTAALAQQVPQVSAQGAPAPGTPATPVAPGYGPGNPGYGPGFGPGPMYRGGRGGRGFGPRAGIGAGVFALGVLLRFLIGIALLVIAWKVITWQSLWDRPDGALQ